MNETFIFVIDTDSYAGNFEREMCAYLTGQTGDCGVGDDLVDGKIAAQFEDIIGTEADEHGCYRPVRLEATPHRWNDGHGKHVDGELERGRYAAYESVGILFQVRPSSELIVLMKKRAASFAAEHKLVITGFRMLSEKATVTQVELP